MRLAAEGAAVVLGDIAEDGIGALAAEITTSGGRAVARTVDVTDEEDCERLADTALEMFGRLDILVAAAGILGAVTDDGGVPDVRRVLDERVADWRRVLDVNLTGVMLSNRAAARRMLAGGGGAIVNISSQAAHVVKAGGLAYSASKAGMWALTKGLSLELAEYAIRVNAVAPGFVNTDMTRGMLGSAERAAAIARRTPVGRIGSPEEIAAVVAFLASDEAAFVDGEVVSADGGYEAGSR
jgi:NAD(P)-dependent dehydrogenase (short-subunit alcohol dehydrogenase family)